MNKYLNPFQIPVFGSGFSLNYVAWILKKKLDLSPKKYKAYIYIMSILGFCQIRARLYIKSGSESDQNNTL